MARTAVAAWLFLALLGHSARAELMPAVKGSSLQRTVGQRLCYAGRFRFERALREGQQYLGRCVEQVPSCNGHPNAQKLDEVHVVLLGNEVFKPELGKTFCLILTAGSKQGFTVEAFGPDDAATRKELEEVITSPAAFENDSTWRSRRALWAQFRKDLGADERPLLYGEGDAMENILYVKEGQEQFPLRHYNARTGKSEPLIHAKVVPGMNRITFEKGEFRVGYNGSIELSIGIEGRE